MSKEYRNSSELSKEIREWSILVAAIFPFLFCDIFLLSIKEPLELKNQLLNWFICCGAPAGVLHIALIRSLWSHTKNIIELNKSRELLPIHVKERNTEGLFYITSGNLKTRKFAANECIGFDIPKEKGKELVKVVVVEPDGKITIKIRLGVEKFNVTLGEIINGQMNHGLNIKNLPAIEDGYYCYENEGVAIKFSEDFTTVEVSYRSQKHVIQFIK